jgi:hypothetical protein
MYIESNLEIEQKLVLKSQEADNCVIVSRTRCKIKESDREGGLFPTVRKPYYKR